MKNLIKLEEVALLIFAFYMCLQVNNNLLIFLLCFFLPDISIAGYLINTTFGSYTYNLFHHKAFSIGVFFLGVIFQYDLLTYAAFILLAHSSFDRVVNYGLKHSDSFKNTHLGKIGGN